MGNRIIEQYKKNEVSMGTFAHLQSMDGIEAIILSGMDYVVLDREHSPISMEKIAQYVTLGEQYGTATLVRVREGNKSEILQALDVGASGVVIPGVSTIEEVRKLVEFAKFEPLGKRGYSVSKDGKWGYDEDLYKNGMQGYMEWCNRNTLLLPQCETRGCLDNIEEIVRIEGVDGIMVGPFDLSIALGRPGEFETEEFQQALDRILKACKDAGKLTIIFSASTVDSNSHIKRGYHSVMLGLDTLTLVEGYKKLLSKIER
ncbi:MAG: aldolase/citrate lyase family protein [Eubacteriales bacterium]